MRGSFLIVALLAAADLPAQDLQPRGELISPCVDTLAVFLINRTDTTRTGIVLDEISFHEADGRRLLRRVYRSRDRILGARTDTLTDDAATLAPVSVRSLTSHSYEAIDFTRDRATGWMRLANGDSVGVHTIFENGAYGSATFDLILRSSPLHESWRVEVPSFLSSTRTVVPLHARVTGSEDVDGSPSWRIQADFSGTPVTFWVDKETRRLVRQVMNIRPDLTILFARPPRSSVPHGRTT